MKINFKIYTIENGLDILRTPTFDIEINQIKNLKKLAQSMKDFVRRNNVFGLAANQIGESVSLFIARNPNSDKIYTCFNPKITEIGPIIIFSRESCLSIPNKIFFVQRFNNLKFEFYDINGKLKQLTVSGLFAQIIQHEIDHLKGKLLIDIGIPISKFYS